MNAKLKLVQNWLLKAQRDLTAAYKLAAGTDPFFDIAVYRCQQAAEKAVKGFLVFHEQPFEKTHDVEELSRWRTAMKRDSPTGSKQR